jgi:hypothetical protein
LLRFWLSLVAVAAEQTSAVAVALVAIAQILVSY